MMLWSMYRIQCVLTLVVMVTLHRSYAVFSCYFGRKWTWVGLTDCGITHPSSPLAWGAVSGWGDHGSAPSGGWNDGFLLTKDRGVNTQISAIFQLPNLNLQRNSGLLSFHYKFFKPGKSTLAISVCGWIIDDVNLQSNGNWKMVKNIRIYCSGREPWVIFTARWSPSSGRVGLDNIRVVSTSPPTTTTQATTTTTFKSSTSTKRTMNTTTKHRTNTTEHTTTTVTTSEWTRSSPRSSGSASTMTALVDTTFTAPLVSIPCRLEAKKRSRTVVAVSLTIVVIVIVIVVLAVIIKRRKSSQRSKVNREGQEITMTRSLNHNLDKDYGIDNQKAKSSTYDTITEGVNPVQQSDQASNGDYGTEEMVVNILYQSVGKDDFNVIPSAKGGVNPVQQSDQASNDDYGTEEMVVNILYQSVDKDDFHMTPSVK